LSTNKRTADERLQQDGPIATRKALMKTNGDQAKIGASMAKGETPFDIEKARKIFAAFEEAATKAPSLFPDNSKTGGDTAADPKIWENIDDFKARLAKLGTDAKDAAAKVSDLDSFKAAFGAIGKNDCGSCPKNTGSRKADRLHRPLAADLRGRGFCLSISYQLSGRF
jgi:cytochrome c556